MLFASCANANDSIASVGAGGLELLKTDNIQMVSEVLEISTKQIKVKYRFLNTSSSDITTTVAFPMPPFSNLRYAEGHDNEGPLTTFKLLVNGAQVQVKMSRVFRINGVDVTDQLRKIGLTEKQIFDPDFNCFSGLTSDVPDCILKPEQSVAIEKLGNEQLGDVEIQETAYWEQVFPSGKEIEVVHEYKPFIGRSYLTTAVKENLEEVFAEPDACMDAKTRKRIVEGYEKSDVHLDPNFANVEYILGTGRNWKGPIKNFRLILKKNSPYEIVSLCFPGKPVKTSPTTIEFTHKDFVPQDKLKIFFYRFGSEIE